ncbi:MAG: hypothetical protein M3114_09495 [Thermoproteota archaeon]|nr:hypothetical protein [Thermoproteota archaeon]MDQ4067805.1 hypothetical protein [Thermoproteota archaeon]
MSAASAGLSRGVIEKDTYTMIVVMVAFTVFIVPVWLKLMYRHQASRKTSPR